MAQVVAVLGVSALFGCSHAGYVSEVESSMPAPDTKAIYMGRLTVLAPAGTQSSVTAATYNGLQFHGLVPPQNSAQANIDKLWREKLEAINAEFGSASSGRILSTAGSGGVRTVLYKYNAEDSLAPKTLVTLAAWKEFSGKSYELEVTAGYGERSRMEQQMALLTQALATASGPVDGSVFVVPDGYLHCAQTRVNQCGVR